MEEKNIEGIITKHYKHIINFEKKRKKEHPESRDEQNIKVQQYKTQQTFQEKQASFVLFLKNLSM